MSPVPLVPHVGAAVGAGPPNLSKSSLVGSRSFSGIGQCFGSKAPTVRSQTSRPAASMALISPATLRMVEGWSLSARLAIRGALPEIRARDSRLGVAVAWDMARDVTSTVAAGPQVEHGWPHEGPAKTRGG